MKKLNNYEKIVRWASEKKIRNVRHMLTELNTNERSLMLSLNRLKRKGLINFTKISSKMIQLNLTQTAYYNRSLLVNAR